MDYKLHHLFNYFDSKPKRYCNRLAAACDYESISKLKEKRPDCQKMVDWFGTRLKEVGVEVILRKAGYERLIPNEYIELPTIIIGKIGENLTKKTLLVYGHLDIENLREEGMWFTDPFDLVEINGNLIGRGPSDDKGPCVAWINVLEAFKKLNVEIPVNIKFLFEAHQEAGSEGFRNMLIDEKHKFLKDVNFVVISDNYWLGDNTPCVTYGLRGICYFFIEIQCSSYDLHSGVYGGCIAEAMADMVYLMNGLREYNGRIHIPNFYDDVDRLEQEEIDTYYNTLDYNCDKVAAGVGAQKLLFKTKQQNLLSCWRSPWITVHGIEGAWDRPGAECRIPHKIIGKISVRLVPHQDPEKSINQFVEFVEKLFDYRGSVNRLKVTPFQDGYPYLGNPEDDNYRAARRAVERVWKKKPDLTREGASIPVVPMIERTLEKPIALIPIGQGSDLIHYPNEKLRRHNYIMGLKVLTAYLFEVAEIVMPILPGYSVGNPKVTPARRFFQQKMSHFNNLKN